jgi:hypothetical protein
MDKSRYVQPDADYRNWLAGKIAEQVPNLRNTATSQMFALSSLEKMYSGLTACPCRGKSTPRADFEAPKPKLVATQAPAKNVGAFGQSAYGAERKAPYFRGTQVG